MGLITLLLAGAITVSGFTLKNDVELAAQAKTFQTYLPNSKIGMEIYRGDYEDYGYKLGLVLYYTNNTYATETNNFTSNFSVDTWTIRIKANDTTIYSCSDADYGSLIIDQSLRNPFGESQTLRANQTSQWTPPLWYFHTVYINDDYILPLDTLKYEMNARDYFNTTTKSSSIKLTAELETQNPIPYAGYWCINLATFKTMDAGGTFSFYSAFNSAIFCYNDVLDMQALTSYSQALYFPTIDSDHDFTYTSTNSRLRTSFGVSNTNENNFYNHAMTSLNISYDDDSQEYMKAAFTATPKADVFNSFTIANGSYFYIRLTQQQRTPSRMYIIKDMKKESTSTRGEISSVLLHEYIMEFKYLDIISGGAPSGGGAGGSDNNYQIECSDSGGILANLSCYLNNALGNILTNGPIFKPLMNFINRFNAFIDNTAGLFFKILDLLKGAAY